MTNMKEQNNWWKTSIIYHIYPRSFYDTNDDGIGDIKGIISKIGYLKTLGVDAIWLSPVYSSPQYDFGYDISDYYQIDPCYGNLSDYKKLIKVAHKHDIRVIMDMVLNHTSIEHPWFLESRSSTDNPKRDWYIWRKGKNLRKPNNWRNIFGGSAWQFDSTTEEYYYHSCFKEQPDLNWRNKEIWIEFKKIMGFWLDLGTDGFRFDVINLIVKDDKLRNNPSSLKLFFSPNKIFTRNRPKSFKIVSKIRRFLDSYGGKVSIGEIYTLPPGNPKLAASYLGTKNNGLHLTFDFSLLFKKWDARKYLNCITSWYSNIPDSAWPALVLSNHDLLRYYNRFIFTLNARKKAFIKAALLLTLRGTPVIYYGDELGMKNSRIKRRKLQDPLGKKYWPFYNGRDKARTPMQWDNSKNAGFSKGVPWLPLGKNYSYCNVHKGLVDKNSLLNFYLKLIDLRKKFPALHSGSFKPVSFNKHGIMAFLRYYKKQQIMVIVNFNWYQVYIDNKNIKPSKVILSTHRTNCNLFGPSLIDLKPFEVLILQIKN
jgi:alpha-glucosidase